MSWAVRLAGAPISWGVVEPPGWGHVMDPDRMLAELVEVGLRATELGPAGYMGTSPGEVRARLDRHGLRLVGGFVPVVLHAPTLDRAYVADQVAILAAGGADAVVLSADGPGRVELDGDGWARLRRHLAEVEALVRHAGLTPSVHPHVGTAIETRAEVDRLLAETETLLCLDTGHLTLGGSDPLELVHRDPGRIAHVHLKDVRLDVAASGLDYVEAVRAGLYAPLGDGDLDIAGIVAALEGAGYRGWYVLEQDTVVPAPPPPGAGPADDVRRSRAYLLGREND
jgi:inosose dehydratase